MTGAPATAALGAAGRDPGSISDVAGLSVGHFTDARRPTGCTVVLAPARGAVAGVDVRGAAPGTRETDLLDPRATIDVVHAIVLAGGSAYGLAAADGAMRWLESRGRGVAVGPAIVPIVPAAVVFDLWVGDASVRPDAAAGAAACDAAEASAGAAPARGGVGVGAGCTVGKLFGVARASRGGVGSASVRAGGATVGALVAVNAIGDVVDPATGRVVAGARRDPAHAGAGFLDIAGEIVAGRLPGRVMRGAATTIGVVATDAPLTKAQCARLAAVAHDGLARTIRPVHTASDGDALFALSVPREGVPALDLTVLGTLAAEAVARAVLDAVRAADGDG